MDMRPLLCSKKRETLSFFFLAWFKAHQDALPRARDLRLSGKLGVFRQLCEDLLAWFLPLLQSSGFGAQDKDCCNEGMCCYAELRNVKVINLGRVQVLGKDFDCQKVLNYDIHLLSDSVCCLHFILGLGFHQQQTGVTQSAGDLFGHCEKLLLHEEVAGRRRLWHQL